MGSFSHGVTRLFGYLEMIAAGHVNPQPEVSVEKESGATALLDGDSGIGIIAARQAMDRAIALSAESGIACVSLRKGLAHRTVGLLHDAGGPAGADRDRK
ncbi:MAG: hypothetical protein Ct9H300mP1_11790 [Planctomycetaceae bacterium]|nr:MAG: hypothetical protein Ct9H300mP1_11790 [Planctomycetaceae bacterium]